MCLDTTCRTLEPIFHTLVGPDSMLKHILVHIHGVSKQHILVHLDVLKFILRSRLENYF